MTKARSWYRFRNAENGAAEVVIYDEIGLWGITAKEFLEDLKALGEVSELVVRINSPGGSVFDGLAIHNALKRYRASVTVFVDGIAASIASVVAMAGDRVVMPENTMLMIHDPTGVVVGAAEDMRKIAEALEKIKASLVSAYRAKSGLESGEIEDLMSEETWLTAAEAVEKGFADEIEGALDMAALGLDLSRFANAPRSLSPSRAPMAAAGDKPTAKEVDSMLPENMTAAEFAAQYPTLAAAVCAEARDAALEEGRTEGRDAGATAELDRILALEAAALPGFENVLAECKADGKSTAADLALKIVAVQKAQGSTELGKIKADADATTETAPAPERSEDGSTEADGDAAEGGEPADEAEALEQAEAKWKKDAKLRASFAGRKAAFLAYVKAQRGGRIHAYPGAGPAG